MSKEKLISTDVEKWIAQQSPHEGSVRFSIVIPAYNEQWRLPTTLIDIVDFFDSQPEAYEVIVVDDGSQDGTSAVIQKFEKIRPQVRHICLPRNRGKGHAVRTGVLSSRGEIILFADADGSTPIMEFRRLLTEIENGSEVAIGSRALHSTDTKVTTRWYRKYLGRIFNFIVNIVVLPGIADTQCGFKMFNRKAARFLFERQQAERYSFDVEVLHIAQKVGMKISEVPINWHNVPGSKVNLVLDALRMLRDTFVFRVRHLALTPSDYQR